ncbi:MAG TPA: Sec-independent protein translocase protein TatB [Casimicrobiaceae bacterium]
MFDIAFSEIVVIAVVALVVIGPERLPKVARTLGHMFGRLQRYVNDVKADISREMELDELRKLQSEVQTAARDLESSMTDAAREMESGVRSVETQLNEAGASPSAATAGAVPEAEVGASARADLLPLVSTDATPSALPAPTVAGEPPRQGALPGFDRI